MRKTNKSRKAFAAAGKVLVGGVNSPVRAFAAVGGQPPVIARARGAKIYDIDGNEYVDYVGSWGPAIIGHANPKVVAAIRAAAGDGSSFGAPCVGEAELAREIISAVPSAQMVRFVSSGTEAVMTALRLARGYTGRAKIVKFIGCYHGHCDAMLVAAGSGAATLGIPSSPGVTPGAAGDTICIHYNDIAAAKATFAKHGKKIAAVIVEPVAGNMGVVPPAPKFLQTLRTLCTRHGALLIFDEVITGFRVARGGSQEIFGIRADLVTLGKIIGGGLPVGAVAGSVKIMKHLAPLGKIYQAGTLSGNPLAMAAGLATLKLLQNPAIYRKIESAAAALHAGLQSAAARAGLADKIRINRFGSVLTVFFTGAKVTDFRSAATSNTRAFAAFFQSMLDAGIYLPPSQYEAWFVSAAHSRREVSKTIAASTKAFTKAAALM